MAAVSLSGSLRFVWSKKFIAVEMNHVIWRISNPDFGFPSNVRCKFSESIAGKKRGNKNKICLAFLGKPLQFQKTNWRNWPGTVNRFNQEKPVLRFRIGDNVGQFSMFQLKEFQRFQFCFIADKKFFGSIADVKHFRTITISR